MNGNDFDEPSPVSSPGIPCYNPPALQKGAFMIERRPPPLLTFLMPVFALLFGFAGLGMGWQIGGRQSHVGDLAKVRVALDRINSRYYPGVAPTTVLDGALEGMTAKLDPYCEYFTAPEFKEFKENNMDGK